MRVKLVTGGGYVDEEKVLTLMDLGFQMQKEFTRGPSTYKTHWVAMNSPERDIKLETLVDAARNLGVRVRLDCRKDPPVVQLTR